MVCRDLLGICGTPGRLTKTIIVSKNPSLLSAYLHFTSYFIRTSDICFHRFEPVSAANSIEESIKTATLESPDMFRFRRNHSGDNNLRSSGFLNKTKRTSGSRSRLPSFNESSLSRHSRHPSTAKLPSQDSSASEPSVFDSRSRNPTAENIHRTNSISRSLAGISNTASRTSIAEVFMETATDDNKLQTVCQVAAQVLDTVRENEVW